MELNKTQSRGLKPAAPEAHVALGCLHYGSLVDQK